MKIPTEAFEAEFEEQLARALKEEESRAEKSRETRRYRAEEYRKRLDSLLVSTCMPPANSNFEIIDTVFAMQSDGEAGVGIFGGKDGEAEAAFGRVKQELKSRAVAIGADAVISCQFEYRVAVIGQGTSSRQCLEIFAYGTAIRFIDGE